MQIWRVPSRTNRLRGFTACSRPEQSSDLALCPSSPTPPKPSEHATPRTLRRTRPRSTARKSASVIISTMNVRHLAIEAAPSSPTPCPSPRRFSRGRSTAQKSLRRTSCQPSTSTASTAGCSLRRRRTSRGTSPREDVRRGQQSLPSMRRTPRRARRPVTFSQKFTRFSRSDSNTTALSPYLERRTHRLASPTALSLRSRFESTRPSRTCVTRPYAPEPRQ